MGDNESSEGGEGRGGEVTRLINIGLVTLYRTSMETLRNTDTNNGHPSSGHL